MKLLQKFMIWALHRSSIENLARLVGQVSVITGTLQSMGHALLPIKIRELGTFQTALLPKDTTYLVAGGKVGASKLKEAEQYGTKYIDKGTQQS